MEKLDLLRDTDMLDERSAGMPTEFDKMMDDLWMNICTNYTREEIEQDMANWRADMLAQGLNPDEDDMELPF